ASVQPVLREREVLLLGTASADALAGLFEEVRAAMGVSEVLPPGPLSVQEGLAATLAGLPLTIGGDLQAARALYSRLFGDLRRYTFVLVGDTTPEAVESAAAQVLPRIRPSVQALLSGPDTLVALPRVPRRAERRAVSPGEASSVAVAFRGTVAPSFDTLAGLDVLAALLEEALDEEGVRAHA